MGKAGRVNKCSLPLAKAQCIHDNHTGTSECPASELTHSCCPNRPGRILEARHWPFPGSEVTHGQLPGPTTNVPIHLHDIISKQWDFNELKR